MSVLLDWLGLKGTILLALLLAVSAWGGVQWAGKLQARNDLLAHQKADVIAVAAIKEQRRVRYEALTQKMADIGDSYEDRLKTVETDRNKLRADLRTARVKLQDYLTCPAPGPGASASTLFAFDAATRLREESASETIADADRADAWIIELQNTIKAYQDGRMGSRQK